MGITFSAGELFDMAITIERNAAGFYRKAASLHADPHSREFLQKLVAMEQQHERIFGDMANELSPQDREQPVYDPDSELGLYLESAADTHGGEGSPVMTGQLTGKETMEQILKVAIELERKSILFFVGMKDMVPADRGREKVDRILSEERSHVAILATELRTIRGK